MEVMREREAAKRELEVRKMWKEGLRDRIQGHKRKRERVGEWIQGVQSPGAEESRPSMQEADARQVIKKAGSETPLVGKNDSMTAGDDAARVVKIETPASTPAKMPTLRMTQAAPLQPTPTLTTAKKPAPELTAKPNNTHAYPMASYPANGANNQMRFNVRDTWPTMAPIPARPDAGSRSRYPTPSDYAAQNQGQRSLAQGPPTQPVYPMMNGPQRGGPLPPGMPNNVSVLSLQPPLRPPKAERPLPNGAPTGNGTTTPWMRYPAPLQQRSFGPRYPSIIPRNLSTAYQQSQQPPPTNAVTNFTPDQSSRGGIDPRMIPRHPNVPGTARILPNGGRLDYASGPYPLTEQYSAAPPNQINPNETALRDPGLTAQWNGLPSTDLRSGDGAHGGAATGR